ncbi:probable G-protein coupled receptor 139 [Chiloscyllium plagiosum]|uniref:probable G-protein coupled receptor 139 n=1 Tax=Chiloscyllium plagiosum TaxID=36176 RepID=UPI001CB8894F|nr:probable G-protein coupled receptor 139 [Chiloscyllium plagiosum]
MHEPTIAPVFAILYPILAIVGVPANLLVIIILSRGQCGLSQCITYYLVAIAVADVLFIITGCVLNRIVRKYFINSVLSTTPGCSLSTVLVYATQDSSVWLTVAFTFDRFVAICSQRMKNRYCTEKTATMVVGIVCALSCITNVPLYFVYKPLFTMDSVPWFCAVQDTFYTSSIWKAYHWLDQILTPFLPFFLILLFNILTIRHIKVASRARKRLCSTRLGEDTELASRKRSIVLLFAISLSFLLLWATYVGHFLYVRVTGERYITSMDFNDPEYIFQEMTNLLQLLSSCNNVFIYVVSQNKFQEETKKLLLSPIKMFAVFFKVYHQ